MNAPFILQHRGSQAVYVKGFKRDARKHVVAVTMTADESQAKKFPTEIAAKAFADSWLVPSREWKIAKLSDIAGEAIYIANAIKGRMGYAGAIVKAGDGDLYIRAVKIRKIRGEQRWMLTEEGTGKEYQLARAW